MSHNQTQGSQNAFRSHKKFEIWEIQTKWIDICKSWDFKLIQEVSLSVFEKSVVKSKALSRWRCSSMTETLGLECSDFLSRDWNRWICQNRTRKHPDTKLSKRLKGSCISRKECGKVAWIGPKDAPIQESSMCSLLSSLTTSRTSLLRLSNWSSNCQNDINQTWEWHHHGSTFWWIFTITQTNI